MSDGFRLRLNFRAGITGEAASSHVNINYVRYIEVIAYSKRNHS